MRDAVYFRFVSGVRRIVQLGFGRVSEAAGKADTTSSSKLRGHSPTGEASVQLDCRRTFYVSGFKIFSPPKPRRLSETSVSGTW